MISESAAYLVAIASQGKVDVHYASLKLQDILEPKLVKIHSAEEIIENIKNKINS